MTDREAAEAARGLTKAQRAAVTSASFSEAHGAWHPEGYYAAADKRVRYAIALRGLTRDYLRRANLLTPLGLRVRAHLQEKEPDRERSTGD